MTRMEWAELGNYCFFPLPFWDWTKNWNAKFSWREIHMVCLNGKSKTPKMENLINTVCEMSFWNRMDILIREDLEKQMLKSINNKKLGLFLFCDFLFAQFVLGPTTIVLWRGVWQVWQVYQKRKSWYLWLSTLSEFLGSDTTCLCM